MPSLTFSVTTAARQMLDLLLLIWLISILIRNSWVPTERKGDSKSLISLRLSSPKFRRSLKFIIPKIKVDVKSLKEIPRFLWREGRHRLLGSTRLFKTILLLSNQWILADLFKFKRMEMLRSHLAHLHRLTTLPKPNSINQRLLYSHINLLNHWMLMCSRIRRSVGIKSSRQAPTNIYPKITLM